MKKKLSVEELLNFDLPQDEVDKFHEKTKLRYGHQIDFNKYPKTWKDIYHKGYPRFKEILLPKPQTKKDTSLFSAIKNRESIREYNNYKVPLSDIGPLCYYSFGQKDLKDPSKGRFYPSAGARYPIELYIISLNTDLKRGVYHYYFKNNSLENVLPIKKFTHRNYLIPKEFKKASFFIVMTAVFERSKIKYETRSYPFIMMEAGHIGQNIYLVSSSLGLKCCAIGGFSHYRMDELLDVDGVKETSIYMFAVGK